MIKPPSFSHGPNLRDSGCYDVAGFTLDEEAAAELAFGILRHYNRAFPNTRRLPVLDMDSTRMISDDVEPRKG